MNAPFVVVDLFPSLLQPEGDHGNAVSLAHRARSLGLAAEVVVVHPGEKFPPADVVMLGGSIDVDIGACAQLLTGSDALHRAWKEGAVVFGVGGGFCVLARTFVDADGNACEGAGLLDVHIESAPLANGPVVTAPNDALALPALSGYEFHATRAIRAAGVPPFAELEVGVGDRMVGNGDTPTDGAIGDRVVGTWLHGPLLPRNPEVSEMLLRWARPALDVKTMADDGLAGSVRAKRINEARLSK